MAGKQMTFTCCRGRFPGTLPDTLSLGRLQCHRRGYQYASNHTFDQGGFVLLQHLADDERLMMDEVGVAAVIDLARLPLPTTIHMNSGSNVELQGQTKEWVEVTLGSRIPAMLAQWASGSYKLCMVFSRSPILSLMSNGYVVDLWQGILCAYTNLCLLQTWACCSLQGTCTTMTQLAARSAELVRNG